MVEALRRGLDPELEAELAPLTNDDELRRFFEARPELLRTEMVLELCGRVNQLAHADVTATEPLLAAAGWLADQLRDETSRGLHLRCTANTLLWKRDFRAAVTRYEAALAVFERAGNDREIVRTLSSGLAVLSRLGDYDRALDWAERARGLCRRLDEPLLLARLEFNVGHVSAQRDRWRDALEKYRAAHRIFREVGQITDIALALRNTAVCHQQLNEFEAAVDAYRQAARFCKRHGLHGLGLEVQYNVASLYYLRGEYTRAIRLFEKARERCEELEDHHHLALCDLDLAEIYLELNLVEEAQLLARRAYTGFEQLGMRYEAAKARTYEAQAADRTGSGPDAEALYGRARDSFAALENSFWTASIDLLRAQAALDGGRIGDATLLAESALEEFSEIGLPAKIALSEILLSKLALERGDPAAARRRSEAALDRLEPIGYPALEFKAHLCRGLAAESQGDLDGAFEALERSHQTLEGLRSHLHTDELRVSFSGDEQAVYEGLIALLLRRGTDPERLRRAFGYVQAAKSRSLSDLLASRVHEIRPTRPGQTELAGEIKGLRSEVNWYHRQTELEESQGAERSIERVEELRREGRERERRLLRLLRRLQTADPDLGALQTSGTADLESIRSSLPENSQLLEFYIVRGLVHACVVDRDRLSIHALGDAERLRATYAHLQRALGKFIAGPEYVEKMRPFLEQTTTDLLRQLHRQLITPILGELTRDHLIVAPSGLLHRLPFHAFEDGDTYLMDRFAVSYAPSGTVYRLCADREIKPGDNTLVLGIPDQRAPLILDEAKAVAGILPNSRLLVGEEATAESLARLGRASRIVHIATHGVFRSDNPMFSAVRLGTSQLSLIDLYNLDLEAELVVLSGCGTGLSAVHGSDELLGLTRGLLYAGARSALVTLWDVNDESTRRFMTRFYGHLSSVPVAEALRRAQREIREEQTHPYYWAPFILVGAVGSTPDRTTP